MNLTYRKAPRRSYVNFLTEWLKGSILIYAPYDNNNKNLTSLIPDSLCSENMQGSRTRHKNMHKGNL